jgi:hypothetical protein
MTVANDIDALTTMTVACFSNHGDSGNCERTFFLPIYLNQRTFNTTKYCTSLAFITSGTLLYFRENNNADKQVCDVLFEGAWATYIHGLVTIRHSFSM